MTTSIGIIGGTGLQSIKGFDVLSKNIRKNKFGSPSAPLVQININGSNVVFIARHGTPHTIAPHKVNYRANIYAMKEIGVDKIISINAVGGISENMAPCTIVLPDQIIDYTYSRDHTFYDDENHDSVVHIDFTKPYCEVLRSKIIDSASNLNLGIITHATYGATQGPRLETAAEIRRLEKDGCDIVGMTGMPEASLACELGISYVSICLVVNWAAGKTDDIITMELIESYIESGMGNIMDLVKQAADQL